MVPTANGVAAHTQTDAELDGAAEDRTPTLQELHARTALPAAWALQEEAEEDEKGKRERLEAQKRLAELRKRGEALLGRQVLSFGQAVLCKLDVVVQVVHT